MSKVRKHMITKRMIEETSPGCLRLFVPGTDKPLVAESSPLNEGFASDTVLEYALLEGVK